MNELETTKQNLPAVMDEVFNSDQVDDLIEGVSGGFGVVSFRGGKWRIKHGGEETLITNADDEPVASIPVVIVKSSRQVSKIFYEKNYEEGDDSSPDCFSIDGVTPDPTAPHKQAAECATCPMNQWGSRITDAGKKAKRCSDNRRVAVVPAARKGTDVDPALLENEMYGGAMLMRVPPASLADMATFARDLKKRYPEENYNSIVTLIGFDPNTAYPKLTFKAVRRLSDEEKMVVVSLWTNGSADNVLSTVTEAATATPAAEKPKPQKAVDTEFEEDEAPQTQAAAEPVPAKEEEGGMEEEEDDTVAAAEAALAAAKAAKAAKAKAAKAKAAKAAKASKGNGAGKPETKPEPAAAQATSGNPDMDGALDDIMGELDDLGG